MLARGALAHWFANVLSIVINIYIAALLTRALGPEGYGSYALLLWLATAAVTFSQLSFPTALTKVVSELRGSECEEAIRQLIQEGLRTLFLNWIIVVLIVSVGSWVTSSTEVAFGGTWAVIVFCALAFSTRAFLYAILYALKYFTLKPIVDLAALIFLAAGLTLFYSRLENQVTLLLYALSTWLSVAVVTLTLRAQGWITRGKRNLAIRARWLNFGFRLSGATLFGLVFTGRLELLLLTFFSNKSQLGFYNLGASMVYTGRRLSIQPFMSLLLAEFSEHSRDTDRLRTLTFSWTRILTSMGLPLGLVGIVAAAPFFDILFGVQFREAVVPFQILLVTVPAFAFSHAALCHLQSIERVKPILVSQIVAAAVFASLGLLLVPGQGAAGAATAWTCAQLMSSGVVVAVSFSSLKGWEPYWLVKTLLITVLSCLLYSVAHSAFFSLIGPIPAFLLAWVVSLLVYSLALRISGEWEFISQHLRSEPGN